MKRPSRALCATISQRLEALHRYTRRRDAHGCDRDGRAPRRIAFTLIEVMIAVGIFFMAMFALLGVLSAGLHAASLLRSNAPTPGMAVALSGVTLTNKLEEGPQPGDFGELYPDFKWELNKSEYMTNGLFMIDVKVYRQGQPYSGMQLLLFKPDSPHHS